MLWVLNTETGEWSTVKWKNKVMLKTKTYNLAAMKKRLDVWYKRNRKYLSKVVVIAKAIYRRLTNIVNYLCELMLHAQVM